MSTTILETRARRQCCSCFDLSRFVGLVEGDQRGNQKLHRRVRGEKVQTISISFPSSFRVLNRESSRPIALADELCYSRICPRQRRLIWQEHDAKMLRSRFLSEA